MPTEHKNPAAEEQDTRVLIRNFIVEVLLYSILVVGYFLVVLRWLKEPLDQLFQNDLLTYAFLSLGLILAQSVALEFVTSFLLEQIRPEDTPEPGVH